MHFSPLSTKKILRQFLDFILILLIAFLSMSKLSRADTQKESAILTKYSQSFSKDSWEDNFLKMDRNGNEILTENPLEGFTNQNSFPASITVGEPTYTLNWQKASKDTQAPAPIFKTLRIDGCSLQIKTGNISLRLYRQLPDNKDFEIANDNVLPLGTLNAEEGNVIYLSAYTSIQATRNKSKACKKALLGKIIAVGAAKFGDSRLIARFDQNPNETAEGRSVRARSATSLYATWNKKNNELQIVDRNGLIPALESDLQELTLQQNDGYYFLEFKTKLELSKSSP
jgi:hypothetical protein